MSEQAGKTEDRLRVSSVAQSGGDERHRPPMGSGVLRLFQVSGITVFLHWSWLLAAVYEVSARAGRYSTPLWNVVEYVGLFVIITLHEFGHAFACRSVGGRANTILLWPFGGIAFVDPPTRAGATLWSIAAGPLVNVALLPVFATAALLVSYARFPDVHLLLRSLTMINIGLLAFNLLPVYPLDGGQILGSLLWFIIGRARSIVVTAVIGLVGTAAIALLALRSGSLWLVLIAMFVGQRCLASLRLAKSLKQQAAAPTRREFACPSCRARPPIGLFWACDACRSLFDMFDPNAGATPPADTELTTLSLSRTAAFRAAVDVVPGECPVCHTRSAVMTCLECNSETALADWSASAAGSVLPVSDVPGVTRLRQPRVPSITALVGGVSLAIVSLMLIATAVLFVTFGSRGTTEKAAFARGVVATAAALATISAGGTVWLLARYREMRREFGAAWQRFHDYRDHGAGA